MNKEEKYPKFTVIIPQKDRAEYLVHTLRTCTIQEYPNFEVIVADDCSEDNSKEVVESFSKKDPRIRLLPHEHHVGMRINFEDALNEVKSGYVMALGGDDGLVPGCIQRMNEIIQETGTPLLTWKTPGFIYPENDSEQSLFSVRREKFKGYKYVKSEDFLNMISQSLFYLVDECPMFYVKGVASIELVNRVKKRTPDHSFYYCPTPDGFSGVVLAGEVEEYVYTNEPLSINGGTKKSQGLAYKRTDQASRKAATQFFDDNARKTMHSELASQPYSPLIPLMTADYLLTAKDLPGWPGRFKMFSFEHLLDKTFEFLETSAFSNEVLERELLILKNIAIQHGLEDLFEIKLKKTKRRIINKKMIDGFFITSNVFDFNGTELNINNIYDAAIATPVAYRLCNNVSLLEFVKFVRRNIRVIFRMLNRKVEYLPKV